MRTPLARTFKLAALLSAAIVSAPAPAHAYRTLADVEGAPTPIVWEAPPSVALDPEGLTEEQAAQFAAELAASIDTWNAAACAGDVLSLAVEGEALVTVRLVADWTERGFNPTAAGTTDVVLASTMDGGTAIVGATISLNGTFAWGPHPQPDADGMRDLRAVITHELGHAVGLEHSEDASSTMFARYAGASQAALALDDIAGLCSIYRAETLVIPPPSCATDEDCDPGHWCIEEECHPDIRFGSECTDGSDCFGARCVAVEGGGTCTYVCELETDCPSASTCLAVMGRDERVCAPSAPSSGCTVSGGGQSMPLLLSSSLLLVTIFLLRRSRQRSSPPILAVLAPLVFTACGTPPMVDSGTPAVDAGPEGLYDAASTDGGAHDSGPDATAARPDAGPTPVCEPGATRVGSCGFCGMQGQTCDDSGQWMPTSACLGQGECAAGTFETRELPMCAEEQRLCLTDCTFGPWESSRGPGICTPGEIRRVSEPCAMEGEARDETCAASCTWEEAAACSNPCGTPPRTTPEWAREVCIPAGNFVRGSTAYTDTQPVAEVYVSSFYIDAYPVTIRRYMQCVDAGACTPSVHLSYTYPGRLDYPAQRISRVQATQFCEWDGGRRLPTEAEWEKAARGPSPRENPYPWSGDAWDCTLVQSESCGFRPPPGRETWAADRYDSLPGTRSYYGTYLQVAGVSETVADLYASEFYADPASRSDPLATVADPGRESNVITRGSTRVIGAPIPQRHRYSTAFNNVSDVAGVRCARSVP